MQGEIDAAGQMCTGISLLTARDCSDFFILSFFHRHVVTVACWERLLKFKARVVNPTQS